MLYLFHWLMVFCFVLMCLACACFAALLVTLALARRAGQIAPQAPHLRVVLALTLAGTLLMSVSFYWSAFGPPPHHPDLPDIVELGGLGAMVAALVVNRKQLGPALALLLRDPGLLLRRFREARRAPLPPPQ